MWILSAWRKQNNAKQSLNLNFLWNNGWMKTAFLKNRIWQRRKWSECRSNDKKLQPMASKWEQSINEKGSMSHRFIFLIIMFHVTFKFYAVSMFACYKGSTPSDKIIPFSYAMISYYFTTISYRVHWFPCGMTCWRYHQTDRNGA